MGFFDKLKSLLIEEVPSPSDADESSSEGRPPDPNESPDPVTPSARLEALAEDSTVPDASYVVQLMEQLRAEGRTARAIALTRKLLGRHSIDVVALRLAEMLSERGEDVAAGDLLAPIIAERGAPLPAVMLAAEIAERMGHSSKARTLYQRVLASDLDFPRARERALRLAGDAAPGGDLAGATIATDGALAKGRYRIERELGRGGAGTVFVATDLRTARRVALKVYHRRGPLERERLRVEVRVPAKIEHPGVVRVFDLDESLSAIAMEWVDGGAVRQALQGEVSIESARRWIDTAAEAVAFVHAAGFAHRDLKPSNFLFRRDGRVVLTDFGLALPLGEAPPQRAGGGEGTLQYMSPEQRQNGPAHAASDVYALGACIRDVLVATPGAPDEWGEIAAACLRKEPAKRPRVDDIREVFSGQDAARVAPSPGSN